MSATETLELEFTDVTGQKSRRVTIAKDKFDSTLGETLTNSVLPAMQLPATDANSRPLAYSAHLMREGRSVAGSERIGDLKDQDKIVLQPSIDAG